MFDGMRSIEWNAQLIDFGRLYALSVPPFFIQQISTHCMFDKNNFFQRIFQLTNGIIFHRILLAADLRMHHGWVRAESQPIDAIKCYSERQLHMKYFNKFRIDDLWFAIRALFHQMRTDRTFAVKVMTVARSLDWRRPEPSSRHSICTVSLRIGAICIDSNIVAFSHSIGEWRRKLSARIQFDNKSEWNSKWLNWLRTKIKWISKHNNNVRR